MTGQHDLRPECVEANEAYKTLRVMGHTGFDLYDHATHCLADKWTHALPTELWPQANRSRISNGRNH